MTDAVRQVAGMAHVALDEVERLRVEIATLTRQLAEADIVIAYAMFDRRTDHNRHINEWADEALERHEARQQEIEDNSQFGVGA